MNLVLKNIIKHQEHKENTKKMSDPLHGKTLEMILTELVETMGWEEMSRQIRINCFAIDPSIKSSLTFLRRTPWARKKVEMLYLRKVVKR